MKGGRLVGLALGVAAVWLALRGVSLAELRHALAAMDASALVPATLLYVGQYLVRAGRQLLLVRAVNPAATYAGELAVLWIGVFCVNTFPARLGEAVRPVLWNQRDGIPLAGGAGVVVAERGFDVLGLLVSLLLVAAYARLPAAGVDLAGMHVDLVATARLAALTALPVTLAVLAGAALLGPRLVGPLADAAARAHGRRLRALLVAMAGVLAGFADGFRALRNVRVVVGVLAATAVYFACMALTALIVARAFGFGSRLGVIEMLGVLVVAMLGVALPAPPAFAGVYEASVRAGLAVFGVAGGELDGQAFAFAIVLHAWTYLVQALGALYFLSREGISLRRSLAHVRGRTAG